MCSSAPVDRLGISNRIMRSLRFCGESSWRQFPISLLDQFHVVQRDFSVSPWILQLCQRVPVSQSAFHIQLERTNAVPAISGTWMWVAITFGHQCAKSSARIKASLLCHSHNHAGHFESIGRCMSILAGLLCWCRLGRRCMGVLARLLNWFWLGFR